MNEKQERDYQTIIRLKDSEINYQINKRKLAEQVRNWVIILSVVVNLLICLL